MPSPVHLNDHGSPHIVASHWVGSYWLATPGTQAADNSTVRLDKANVTQPDVLLLVQHRYGGQARVSADDYLEGAPELVIEIAASSASYDTNAKLRAYQRNGVREYVVWLVEKQQVDWYILRGKKYDRLAPSPTGLLCSEAFPGLWLDTVALFAGDYNKVMAVLQQGIADPSHAAFVAELASRVGKTP